MHNKFAELHLRASHVFNSPLDELLWSVTNLLKGAKETEFFWFDEPGVYKFEFKIDIKQYHIVHISITEYDSIGDWNENDKVISENRYCVKLQHLSANLYGEMVKLNELMKIKSYSANRDSSYPYSLIKKFTKQHEQKYS